MSDSDTVEECAPLEAFLGGSSKQFVWPVRAALPEASRSNVRRICLPHLLRVPTTIHQVAAFIFRVPPSVVTHTLRLGNINPIPIDYAFRPRLRDRLTLRRLTLRRNPWTYGDSVFHTVCRYSCQHSHFCNLQELSRVSLRRRQNAPLPHPGISDQ